MDSFERARRALTRLPPSSSPAEDLITDVADAIRGAIRAALLDAAKDASGRVYKDVDLEESKHRRAEAAAIATHLEKLAEATR